ncbi:unnamed protein product, partial [Ectocarpus sp. 8 AP-2014]
SDRDRAVIEADEACDKAAAELEKGREARSKKMAAKQRETFARRRAERADAWTEQLPIQDQQMFATLRTQWLKHDNVTVHPTHKVCVPTLLLNSPLSSCSHVLISRISRRRCGDRRYLFQ